MYGNQLPFQHLCKFLKSRYTRVARAGCDRMRGCVWYTGIVRPSFDRQARPQKRYLDRFGQVVPSCCHATTLDISKQILCQGKSLETPPELCRFSLVRQFDSPPLARSRNVSTVEHRHFSDLPSRRSGGGKTPLATQRRRQRSEQSSNLQTDFVDKRQSIGR